MLDDIWSARQPADEYRRYVADGGNIRVRFEGEGGKRFRALRVTLLSKSLEGDGWSRPFQEHCTAKLTDTTEVLSQYDKNASTSLLWMIRISAAGDDLPDNSQQTPVRIRFWGSNPATTVRSMQPGLSAIAGIVPELACQERPRIRYQTGASSEIPFATRIMLLIAIDDHEVPLEPASRAKLGLYLTKAFGTWNAACFNCATNNLLLIKVGQDLYLNSILASAYRQAARAGLAPEFMADLDIMIALMRRNASASGVPYEVLKKDDQAIAAICSNYRGWQDPRMAVVRSGLGCPSATDRVQDSEVAQVTLKLVNGLTHCLNRGRRDPNIIACEEDGSVELDTKDFSFVSHESAENVFGKGNRAVDLLRVLTHEVGHWIGLGHLTPPGIMAADFRYVDCINDTVVDRLLQAGRVGRTAQRSALSYR